MYSKISVLALGLILVSASVNAQQYSQLGGRRSADRLNLLRQYDDGSRASPSRAFQDAGEQRFSGQGTRQQQEQDAHDRRADYENEDYSYAYAVRDEVSGDIKSQQETRNGDRVRGQYRTVESDGTERIVDYTADDHRGFHAVVRHQPSVGTRAQLVHTLQPAVLLRPAAHGGHHRHQPLTLVTAQPSQGPSVLLHH